MQCFDIKEGVAGGGEVQCFSRSIWCVLAILWSDVGVD